MWAWLQPNGGTGEANAGFVLGDGAATIVDTCWDRHQASLMMSAVREHLGSAEVTEVVNTHSNGDHWWGNSEMPATAEIVTSAASLAEMGQEKPGQLAGLSGALGAARRLPGAIGSGCGYLHAQLAPFDFASVKRRFPERTFEGSLELLVGGRDLVLRELGPAHTAGDLVVWVPDERVLFAGDLLFVDQTPVMWAGTAAGWASALTAMSELGAEVVVPGHGPPGAGREVEIMRDYWEWLGAGASESHRRGLPELDATLALVADAAATGSPWAGWAAPERTYISVAREYRSLRGDDGEAGTRQMLASFRGLVRTKLRLDRGRA